ncbi:hypothetical protein HPB51_016160 [Rhipicephalus microplus]|uniref:Uncharacterized protein n=1 Tax=Rhipicephalus microplus TaxID=6941 RepID=A0A9J6E2E5_RHIMP|nr:hypothetical protein HPB51_016160 [Rhipicephalus microplus]
MYAAIPLPMFLQCPGRPPIPWQQWRPLVQVYVDAAVKDAPPEHKKALLLNALGVEGLMSYLLAVEDESIAAVDHTCLARRPPGKTRMVQGSSSWMRYLMSESIQCACVPHFRC